MANYLLELGCEEIPARFAPLLLKDLSALLYKRLADLGFCCDQTRIETYGTYRRLAMVMTDLLKKQDAKEPSFLGPPMTAAKREGQWSQAAIGFAKKHGVALSDLKTAQDAKGRDVLCVKKREQALSLETVLADELPKVIKSMHLPIAMHWGDGQGPFFRPVHWIVSLLDDRPIAFDLFGIKASQSSFGHRFLSDGFSSMGKSFVIKTVSDYVAQCKAHQVLVRVDERKKGIEAMLDANASSKERFEALIEEVTWLCEYPQAIMGHFDARFLNLPEAILVSSMAKHQKYFATHDTSGALQSSFLLVSDNMTPANKKVIQEGNEAVLRARFNDVAFFWEQDTKSSLESYVPKLKEVVFQKGAGTVYDRIERMQKMATYLIDLWSLESKKEAILRAIYLCKADLVTQMVGELPALQGFVGSKYAQLTKESKGVCEAIETHYLPLGEGRPLPKSIEAKLVALVDKLDLMVTSYHVGYKPTSSKDPLGIRRAMLGVLRILLEINQPHHMKALCLKAASFVDKTPQGLDELYPFFSNRVGVYFSDLGIRKDIVAANKHLFLEDLNGAYKRLSLFEAYLNENKASFIQVSQAAIRVARLTQKLDQKPLLLSKISADSQEEKALKALVEAEYQNESFSFSKAVSLARRLDCFFEAVMVMHQDKFIRLQRLSLLVYAKACFDRLGCFEGIEL